MKKLLLLPMLVIAFYSFASTAAMEGKVTRCGIVKISNNGEIIHSPQTPSGITKFHTDAPVFTVITNRIPAKIGVKFGFEYEIENVSAPDGVVVITKIARHPAITKPDGSTSTGFTFVEKQFVKGGKVTAWTGYGFDHDYELASGDWEFEMQYAGQTVCKQKFTVFKE